MIYIWVKRKIYIGTGKRWTGSTPKCQQCWDERFLLSVYIFCNWEQMEHFCCGQCLAKHTRQVLLDEGHHGCKVSGVLIASLVEVFWPWEPGALTHRHGGDEDRGHKFPE